MADTSENSVEIAKGAEIEIRFDAALCIHSRFCVLQAPNVFKANTPGEWILPDLMNAPALAAVARNCPSGAITYHAKEAVLNEVAPPVNTVRLRQDGPYAVNANIEIAGCEPAQPATRRTLCRCGASNNKPYCDGSHVAAKFQVTGEPETEPYKPLDPRDGPLRIIPLKNGPLEVAGAAELVSGTGRTFGKITHSLLCRCGGSNSKPYCDGTHSLNGFSDRKGFEPPEPAKPEVKAPSLSEFAGGREKLKELTTTFYRKVPSDPLLGPIFAHMDQKHAEHVADFLAEVFGGPPIYTNEGGAMSA